MSAPRGAGRSSGKNAGSAAIAGNGRNGDQTYCNTQSCGARIATPRQYDFALSSRSDKEVLDGNIALVLPSFLNALAMKMGRGRFF